MTQRLLRDLIHIPESVHKGDLVYQLADATADADKTVRDYVVTDQLRAAFMDAVKLLRSAVTEGSSKAAYLHGSFGSGKSNFMGVLQLLLDGNPSARAVPELAEVVAELDDWKGDRRFLTVPFHLIGENDLESAVFGQYVRHLAELHPDAPPPAVFADEPILANADSLRADLGDEVFFARLSEDAAGDDDGWGDLAAGWDAASYDAARHAPHGSLDRTRLVQAILTTWLTSFADAAHANRGGYVAFEDGLSAISVHAQSLGYGGVILFLDELILWFLSRLADTAWVSEEASKLSKLVEAATASRPVPIVSIIARQRDLRDLVGDSVPGAEKLSFAQQLDYQAGRFDTITLDDSNLPVVANRRLLTPIDDAAQAELQSAFTSLSLSERVHDVLLAETGDDRQFALTYPFSPAFMTVLVDVAGALQRTRTGLRVLLELLVQRRDELVVGQLVPVGDLYDVIDASDDPVSDTMRAAFDQARRIYGERLRPALLAEHGLGAGDEPTTAFTNDDRMVKTLLLAAMVPQSVPFKNLTVERLVALNHGTIASPVPGQETAIAVNKLRHLQAQAGELRLGDDPNNPTVAVVLSDVDTDTILATADSIDNNANRRTLVRELVMEGLGLPLDQIQSTYTLVWKGLRREVSVVFGNIRDTADLPDSSFANDGPSWKLVIDFPFDEPGHSPREDLARLEALRESNSTWSTVCWLPAFFTASTLDVLGRLLKLNHILNNDQRFTEATASLSPVARQSAKPLLEAMRTAARSQLDAALLGAYGVTTASEKAVDASHSLANHFPSLKAGLDIAPPTRANLRDALDQVLDQALRFTYPGAPDLGETEVRPADVRKVADLCATAVVETDGRLMVGDVADRRLLARIANPLEFGVQSEQAFKIASSADRWDNTFTRVIGQSVKNGIDTITVGLLRRAINEPQPMGLTAQLENLIIVTWAHATSHRFRLHGGPAAADVDHLDDNWEVVEQPLPSAEDWTTACELLASVFGVTLTSRHVSGFAVEQAGIALAKAVDEHRDAIDALVAQLDERGTLLGVDDAAYTRLRTAVASQMLMLDLDAAEDDLARVEALAQARLPMAPLTLAKSITTARSVADELAAAQFEIITGAMGRPGGEALRDELLAALTADEFVTPLAPVLHSVQQGAVTLLSGPGPDVAPPPAVPPVVVPPSAQVWQGSSIEDARTELDRLAEAVAAGTAAEDSVQIHISWLAAAPDASAAEGAG